jgi:hypothetical protein
MRMSTHPEPNPDLFTLLHLRLSVQRIIQLKQALERFILSLSLSLAIIIFVQVIQIILIPILVLIPRYRLTELFHPPPLQKLYDPQGILHIGYLVLEHFAALLLVELHVAVFTTPCQPGEHAKVWRSDDLGAGEGGRRKEAVERTKRSLERS